MLGSVITQSWTLHINLNQQALSHTNCRYLSESAYYYCTPTVNNYNMFESTHLIYLHINSRYVPESARWLMIRGRVSEAEDILSDIAMKNGIAVPKMLLQVSRPLYLPATRYGCLDLIKTKSIAKKTIVLVYLWWVVILYGLSNNGY